MKRKPACLRAARMVSSAPEFSQMVYALLPAPVVMSALRRELMRACEKERFALRLAGNSLCTDNAAMIGILAERKLSAGLQPTLLDQEITPGWVLASNK